MSVSQRLRATRALLRDVLTLHDRFQECVTEREVQSIIAHLDYIRETIQRMREDPRHAAHRPPYEERVLWRFSDALRRKSVRPSRHGSLELRRPTPVQRPSLELPLDVVAGLVRPNQECHVMAMSKHTTQLLAAIVDIVRHTNEAADAALQRMKNAAQ